MVRYLRVSLLLSSLSFLRTDAAALAHADVSFAVGGAAAVAREAADVSLLSGDLINVIFTLGASMQRSLIPAHSLPPLKRSCTANGSSDSAEFILLVLLQRTGDPQRRDGLPQSDARCGGHDVQLPLRARQLSPPLALRLSPTIKRTTINTTINTAIKRLILHRSHNCDGHAIKISVSM